MNLFMQKTGLGTAARWFSRLGAGLRILVSGAVVLLAMMPVLVLHAQTTTPSPSTNPLLNRDGGGVKPNVMLIVDDSGSMLFQHMPDSLVYLGASPVASISPVRTVDLGSGMRGSHSVKMHPTDTMILASVYAGVVAGSTTSSNWRQAFMRSPDTNTIYYNPEVRYLPWVRPDTTRMPNSTATSAPIDPMNWTGTRVNLQTVAAVSERWCAPPGSNADCSTANGTTATVSLRFNPMLYYRLQKNADNSFKSTTNIANYDRYDLNPLTLLGLPIPLPYPTFTKYPARTDCSASFCTLDEERVNFANWFTYYRSRALLAKGGLSESFVSGSNTFRIGHGVINDLVSNDIDGVSTNVIQQGVRDFTTAQRSTTIAWLQGLPISGGTPLRSSLDIVGQYYTRSDNGGPWSDNPSALSTAAHKSCRRSYMFMVTDGYWNDTVSGVGNSDNTAGVAMTGPGYSYPGYTPGRPFSDDASDTLADYAMKYWKTDLRGGTGTTALTNNVVPTADNPAFWQHMSSYFIGLGVRGTLNPDTDLPYLTSGTKTWTTDRIDDLWHAAVNSRGAYFSAKDSTELANAIRSSLSATVERELREAGVATATTILENGNRKYVPFYRTSAWNGDVTAYSLDAMGVAGAVQWTAEAKLPPWASRNIVTWDRGGLPPARAVPFTWADISLDSKLALGSITATYTATLVDFLRGDRSQEGPELSFRQRDGVLGDFINSNPVVVLSGFNGGYSGLSAGGSSYTAFLNQKATRTFGVLFIGGNDGMLHGFKDTKTTPATDGREVFAYVPRGIYPSLPTLATRTYGTSANYHRFYVDGPLEETDAFIPATGSTGTATWRNMLLGSTGAGGRVVFALDVTDTSNLGTSTVKWELSDADDTDLGYVMSPIESGVLPNGEWVAIFGNGYYSSSGLAKLFVVTLKDGVIRKLTVNSLDSNNGLGGVAVVRDSTGYIQSLYAGDLAGKMWRMDYSAAASSFFTVGLGGNRLVDAKTSVTAVIQPITQRPEIYPHPNGGNLVVFGTGQLLTTTDADSTLTHSLYGVWDKTSPTTTESLTLPLGRTYLKSRAITTVNGTGGAVFYSVSGATITWTSGNDRGWVIDLGVTPGLRLVYPPQKVSSNEVLMSTVAPAANVAQCESGIGRGINFVFDVFTGANPTYPFFDTNGDGLFTSADTNVGGYATGADGVDAIVKGNTTCSASGLCSTRVSFQNTTGQMGGQAQYQQTSSSGSPRVLTDRLWRRIINPPIP